MGLFLKASRFRSPAGFGDAWVIVVDFSRPVKAHSILAYGQSSRPDSLHSGDQIGLFSRGEYKPVWFSVKDILAHLEREYYPDIKQ
jgi:acyl-homoserine-lactone acylase